MYVRMYVKFVCAHVWVCITLSVSFQIVFMVCIETNVATSLTVITYNVCTCNVSMTHTHVQLTTLNLEGQNREQQLRTQLVRELTMQSYISAMCYHLVRFSVS